MFFKKVRFDKWSALVQVEAWCLAGDKLCSEPMLTIDAVWFYLDTMG